MIDTVLSEPLLLASSILIGSAVFMFIRFPLNWWIRPVKHIDLIHWDLDDNRRKLLRHQSPLFHKLEPWIVGLANSMDDSWPILNLDPAALNKLTSQQRTYRKLFGTRDSVVLGLRTGVISGAWSASEYVATMVIVSLGMACSVSLLFFGMKLSIQLIMGIVVFTAIVFRVQLAFLEQSIKARQSEIRRLLPHAMEILSMTMSAGGTFEAGVEDVIRDFPGHPLVQELERMIKDLKRGVGMYDALQNVAKRVRIEEFDDVLRTLTISHEHGAPASELFRRGAKQMRTKHLRAMEIAVGRAEAKMPLPTMVITIACMIIAIAPFVVGAIESGIMEMFRK